jgi:hypothetical protein
MPSEYGHDASDRRVVELVPLVKGKIGVVDLFRTKEKEGLRRTGVVTGLFFDWVNLETMWL